MNTPSVLDVMSTGRVRCLRSLHEAKVGKICEAACALQLKHGRELHTYVRQPTKTQKIAHPMTDTASSSIMRQIMIQAASLRGQIRAQGGQHILSSSHWMEI
ncbi:hypothetical protein XENOCAPTIV_001715 [Xenoophorus captivus]|uniref:Uncharacterized protein n=1 Tax=Xenoophorus captivus TaxID=1517983 RepID=A0ABV0QPD4_9TELE